MNTIPTKDDTICFWGHGWPFNADVWGSQMLSRHTVFRCIAHDH